MKPMHRILSAGLLLAAGTLGVAGTAQAGLSWSLGLGLPGLSIGMGNVPAMGYPYQPYAAYPAYGYGYAAPMPAAYYGPYYGGYYGGGYYRAPAYYGRPGYYARPVYRGGYRGGVRYYR